MRCAGSAERHDTSFRQKYSRALTLYIEHVTDPGDQLRAARATLGITQAQAADLLGTSQANVSAYEHGRLVPGRVVAERIAAMSALTPTSRYATTQASTLASTAARMRADLRVGRSATDTLRLAIQASDDFAHLEEDADRAFFLSEPSPSGSRQWDALLSGLAVHLCRAAGLGRTPTWTRDAKRTVDMMWWVDSDAVSLRAQLLRDALPSMRSRGVILGRRTLESV